MTRSLEALVAQQVARWNAARKAGEAPPRTPCVAMSRLPFALGGDVGRRVAERLDYGFFGRELIDEIERIEGVQHRLIEGVDERIRDTIARYVSSAIARESFNESDYLKTVVRTLTTLSQRGMAVILGRGAPFVLSAEQALRVLVVAPWEQRLENFMKAERLEREDAHKRLERIDVRRAEFARHQFGVDQSNPVLYDLVVNTGTLGVEGAADLVVAALAQRFPHSVRT